MRIAHFSDIHITADSSAIPWRAMLSKRIFGWLNLQLLGRKGDFAEAAGITAALVDDLQKIEADHILFSGDLTGLASTPYKLNDYLPCPRWAPIGARKLLPDALDVLLGLHLSGEDTLLGCFEEADLSDPAQIHADGVIDYFGGIEALFPGVLNLSFVLIFRAP